MSSPCDIERQNAHRALTVTDAINRYAQSASGGNRKKLNHSEAVTVATSRSVRAWSDLKSIVSASYVWRALAWADIRSKYRLSTLGTLWITLSTGVTAVSIGLIYGQFFGQNLSTYLPYFTAGMIFWTFIASVIGESTQALISSGSWIKGANLPIVFYVMRMLQRNFLILLHNFIIVALVWLYYRWDLQAGALMCIVGLGLTYAFLLGLSLMIAIACVRYRDVPPMVAALIQFIFLASPIIWHSSQVKVGSALVWLNPITHLLAVTRDPLIGLPIDLQSFGIATGMAGLSLTAGALIYERYRDRIAYWV